jgi:putative ABC transport system permease protein
MGTLLQDIRYAFRMLIKHMGFTAVALITIALGIGANTAIFSVVNTVLLRPLPYANPDQIVAFEGVNPSQGITDSNISVPDFMDWTNDTQVFSQTALYATGGAILAGGDAEPERVPRAVVTSSFFPLLGVQPALGRAFISEEDRAEGEPVAILSHGLWQRHYGGNSNVLGSKVTISGRSVTIVGVMPAGFDFPEKSQLWTSLRMNPTEERRDNRSYSAIARLNPGATLAEAQSQLSTINKRLAQQFKDTNNGWDVRSSRLQDILVREAKPALVALLGAVGFVLLIACANVGNLLLARAAARQREMAIRAALGASRARVIRQMLTESVMLSTIGGIIGVLLSVWLTDLLVSISPRNAPRFDEVTLDYRVLVFAAVVSCLTGVLFGLAPALQAAKTNVSGSLKDGGRGTGDSYRRNRVRSVLLVSEVALSLMLLVGAGLLIKSFQRLRDVNPGFNAERVVTMSIALPSAKYPRDKRVEFFRQLVERLNTIPGVQSAGAALMLPLGGSGYSIGRAFISEGRPMTPEESANASYSLATPRYFQTMQIPLIAGRDFNDRDTPKSPMVVIVNQTMAQRCFGSAQNALGKKLTIWRDEKFPREVVGVVGDVKLSTIDADAGAQMYVPQQQDDDWNFLSLAVRSASADAAGLTPAIRREILAIDKDQPVYNVQTMEDVAAKSIGSHRVSVLLFSAFAGVALMLAAIGIYGVMAYSVTQRTQEIGIRMALGAQTFDVLKLVVKQGMSLTLVGIVVGLAGAFALARMLASLLFGVGTTDPMTFLGVSLLLSVVALLACYIPARRATKLNPTIALANN